MSLDINLDVNIARVIHLKWEEQLEALIRGKSGDDLRLSSHEDCDLGVWIYSSGLQKYAQRPEIWALKDVHKAFHRHALEVTQAVAAGDEAAAEAAMQQVRGLSKEIIYQLTQMELAIIESRQGGGGLLRRVIGGGPVRSPLAMVQTSDAKGLPFLRQRSKNLGAMLLNVNVARLIHMRWTQELERSFRKRGRKLAPQPAEECDLGVWLHGAALKHYQDSETFLKLDEVHKRFHHNADRTISFLNRRHYQDADKAYDNVKELSRDVVFLLTRIEREIEDYPSLFQRLFTR
ncbi:MAG: CZB domain-containing protein [Gammaproteobacteria bacterium SHHR-1]|uniref:CZB domain-containing protein n=1 Tax=Magnetovirga frankeli TaxID=947516 RepID=UPI001AF4C50F|nr:CZB domain-containing protein [gamma proteobacterium SS-5]